MNETKAYLFYKENQVLLRDAYDEQNFESIKQLDEKIRKSDLFLREQDKKEYIVLMEVLFEIFEIDKEKINKNKKARKILELLTKITEKEKENNFDVSELMYVISIDLEISKNNISNLKHEVFRKAIQCTGDMFVDILQYPL